MRLRSLVLATALLACVSGGVEAQLIEGAVRASDSDRPVSGARVVLLDGDDVALTSVHTDFEGRFLLHGPAAGEFRILVERPGFANLLSEAFYLDHGVAVRASFQVSRQPLGIMMGPERLEAAFSRHIEERCGVLPGGDLAPALVGLVTDSESGVALPGVAVSMEWSGRDAGLRIAQTWSDDDGVYIFCDPPRNGRPRIRAEALGTTGESVALAPRVVDHVIRLDLGLPLTEEGSVGYVFGQVVDHETGQPLSTVEVGVRGAELWTLSDRNGFFRFEAVPPGVHVLDVERVGYEPEEKVFWVVGRAGHHVGVSLSREAILLEPITVAVRSRRWFSDMSGLQDRMAAGIGHFVARPEIVARGLTRLADLAYGVPGFVVERMGRKVSLLTRRQRCAPTVFLDGQPHRPDEALGVDAIPAFDLEAAEFYRSASEVPAEFHDATGCGAVVAWTRRGR